MTTDSELSMQTDSAADDREKMLMRKAEEFLSQIFLIPDSALPASF